MKGGQEGGVDDTLEERQAIWSRLEAAAFNYHNHPPKHGFYKRIARDAARAQQTIGDWKAFRSPVPRRVIEQLADLYDVCPVYLLTGKTEPLNHTRLREQVNVMVTHVIDHATVDVSAKDVLAMCDVAIQGLCEDRPRERIYGELFLLVHPAPSDDSAAATTA